MFYDRETERKKLTEMLQSSDGHKAKIILLLGYSGVGKTGLMSELFSTTLSHRAHICVHVSNIASTSIENCYYLNRLYDEILKKSKFNVSLNISTSSPLVSLRIRQLIRFIIRWIASVVHIYENEDFIEDKKSSDLLQKRDFIIEYLNEEPHIVDFENMQRIDMQSLEFLKDIAEHTSQTVFVFEYTLNDTDPSEYYKFYAEIERFPVEIKIFHLESLNETDALRLSPIKIKSKEQQESILNVYHAKHGNLYQILLYHNQAVNVLDQIQDKIRALVHDRNQSTSLFLLNLCYLNGGNIAKSTLQTLATTSSSSGLRSEKQFSTVLKGLISQNIIQEKNAGVCIHDSVLAALEQQEMGPMLYHAYHTLVRHYMSWTPTDAQQQVYRLSQLFSLYLRFTDDQILTILPDIRRAVISCKYPQAIYHSLQQFIDLLHQQPTVNQKVYQEVCKLLLDICIETGETDTAWKILKKLPDLSSNEKRILEARIYELGMKQTDFDGISCLIEDSTPRSHERLLLELSRIHVAMRIWTQDKIAALIQEIIDDPSYAKYPEYAFALSDQAELVDSPPLAIALYQRGISILLDHGMDNLAGYLYTNICMSYGYMGEMEKAAENLELARKAGIDEAVYLNNLAALNLLMEKPSEKSAARLQDALLLHSNPFERLIIHNNLLITRVLLRDWPAADAEYDYLCSSEFEMFQYGEFLQMCYQNLLFYNREKGANKEAELYIKKLTALIESPSVSIGTKAVAQAMLEPKNESDIFYGRYPYRAEFLCYWGIPPAMR